MPKGFVTKKPTGDTLTMTGTSTFPMTWNAGDHDAVWPIARLLFAAAQHAYTPTHKALPGFRDIGLDAEFIQERPTQAYAAHAGHDALIAFRGQSRS